MTKSLYTAAYLLNNSLPLEGMDPDIDVYLCNGVWYDSRKEAVDAYVKYICDPEEADYVRKLLEEDGIAMTQDGYVSVDEFVLGDIHYDQEKRLCL